ncbi:MAG: hypothetical protein J6Q22_09710 [Prevotella sp.]|nr:hypothetical protein [Prevotella sp.]
MAIKKNAAKADIGSKKQVKATFAECTAEDPLKCRYHGPKMLQAELDKLMGKGAAKVKKTKNGYEITSDDAYDAYEKVAALLPNAKGSLGFKKAIFILGDEGFVTPEGEAELEDADTLSSEDAPKNNTASNQKNTGEDPFAELDNIDTDALIAENELDADLLDNFDELDEVVGEATEDLEAELLGNTDFDDDVFADEPEEEQLPKDLTDEQIKDLVSFKGITDEHFETNQGLMENYKAIILHGLNPSWSPLNDNQKAWWNDLLSKTKNANEDELPALKVLKATMAKVNGGGEQGGNGDKDASQTPSEEDYEKFVAGLIRDPFPPFIKTDAKLLKEIVEKGTVNGKVPSKANIDEWEKYYGKGKGTDGAVKDAVNAAFAKLQDAFSTQNHEAEMEKCAAKWNNLMDTAINGKHLLGTQYWAETLQPIVEAYNDAVEANDAEKAYDAVYDLKNAVKDAPESKVEKPTKDSLIAEMGNVIAKMKGEGLDLTWDAKKGNALGKAFEDAINAEDIEGATKALDNFKEYVEFLESGGDAPEEDDGLITDEDVQEFYDAVGVGMIVTPEQIKASKELCNNGTWDGFPPTAANKKWFKENAKKFPDLKFSKAVLEALKPKKKGKNQKSGAKEALASALSGNNESMVVEGMLKPLEHDDAKFPQNITQKELDEAIKKGKKLGGHGGLGTRLVEIGGKQYVCKAATGTGASVIRNGYNADMAYRAGGVYALDAQLYEFGDGKTYKLSEFIPGKRLIDVWQTADEAKRDEIRKELLKGYPLDVLFSNYDVLGTSPEDSITVTIQGADGKPQKTHVAFNNIMIGDDGHAYRVDNDGSFAMTGTGGIKHSSGGGYITKVEAEKWGKWEDRQWIDDFRTLRRNEKNLGIFDRYSTADIFLSAGNINLDAVVGTLPQGIQKALAKPLFEMKQMTWRALNLSLGGYKNDSFVSMALDASYEASKRGLRELCKKEISWDNAGFGTYKESWTNYQMQEFGENPPEKPQNPAEKLKKKLTNDEYTGSNIIGILLDAVKTINNHGGVKQFDSEGKPLGNGSAMPNPDYTPNPIKIAAFEKIDREKLEELAKTDENAKKCLGIYDTIIYSKENGWKKPIGQIPTDLEISAKLPEGFQSPTEKKILSDMEGAMAEYAKVLKEYEEVLLPEYEARKTAHMKAEEARARKSGGSIFHNFNHFADVLITEGVSTDGISHKVKTAGVKPIEASMSAQKDDSYNPNAVKWKIREMMALGYSAKQIRDMVKKGDLYSGESYSKILDKAKDGTTEEWGREMASQAIYCGLQMLKKENEVNDQIDKDSGVVFLNRNIGNVPNGLSKKEEELYKEEDKSGWVGAHLDSAADCMQFESNSWHKPYKQVYAVPFSRLVCCANDQMANGGDFGYDSEHEWVGNLLYLPCFVYHESQGYTWKGAIDAAQKTSGMKGFLKKFADRLGIFSTHK